MWLWEQICKTKTKQNNHIDRSQIMQEAHIRTNMQLAVFFVWEILNLQASLSSIGLKVCLQIQKIKLHHHLQLKHNQKIKKFTKLEVIKLKINGIDMKSPVFWRMERTHEKWREEEEPAYLKRQITERESESERGFEEEEEEKWESRRSDHQMVCDNRMCLSFFFFLWTWTKEKLFIFTGGFWHRII